MWSKVLAVRHLSATILVVLERVFPKLRRFWIPGGCSSLLLSCYRHVNNHVAYVFPGKGKTLDDVLPGGVSGFFFSAHSRLTSANFASYQLWNRRILNDLMSTIVGCISRSKPPPPVFWLLGHLRPVSSAVYPCAQRFPVARFVILWVKFPFFEPATILPSISPIWLKA